MSRYDGFIALAKKLILKNADGQTLDFTEMQEGSPLDPGKPWKGGAKPSRQTVATKIPYVAFNYKAAETSLQSALTAGSTVGKLMVPDAKQLFYIAAADMAQRPKIGQRANRGTHKWEVLELEVIAPGAVDILYVIYVGD